ncbi:MAG: hypothetical protein ACMUHB_01750 [Thermoplasmatota archaeon]
MGHGWKRPFLVWVFLAAIAIMLFTASLTRAIDRESTVYKDKGEDVVVDTVKGPLDRLMDLENIDGEKANDIMEAPNVDISSLTIIEDSTYVSYIITVDQKIQTDNNYTYYVCGYTREDPEDYETFDFIISYSGGDTSYRTWREGQYVEGANVSMIKIEGATLNLTMNRNHFILNPNDPFLVCAIVVLQTGEGKDRFIDYVITNGKNGDDGAGLDETTIVVIQMIFIGILVVSMLLLWNFWARKKGPEIEGGVCPRCEARLDKNLDFCPHCGSFIRGPQADKENPKPRIVSPLDLEMEE